MMPLHTFGKVSGLPPQGILKVLGLAEALDGAYAPDRVLVDVREGPPVDSTVLASLGFAGTLSRKTLAEGFNLAALVDDRVVGPGDVVRLDRRGQVSVRYRRGANANFLLATERCNSLCLMCSQPPRPEDDSWRVAELLDTIELIDPEIPALGITGGEPTLLGEQLARLIEAVRQRLPVARLNILTNARLFAEGPLADLLARNSNNVLWAVPLYADVADVHDFVVQSKGAFDETLNGLYNLAERKQAIEIRCVIHKVTLPRLKALAEFIWRNLPFVRHVALMGLEPMGYAKLNREQLYIDPADYSGELEEAAWYLHDRGIPTSIYNTPLCLLSPPARKLARRSISDWKNNYAPACAACARRGHCAGFFASADANWRSRAIAPIIEEDRHEALLG